MIRASLFYVVFLVSTIIAIALYGIFASIEEGSIDNFEKSVILSVIGVIFFAAYRLDVFWRDEASVGKETDHRSDGEDEAAEEETAEEETAEEETVEKDDPLDADAQDEN